MKKSYDICAFSLTQGIGCSFETAFKLCIVSKIECFVAWLDGD